MKYSRKNLVGRKWHKVVLNAELLVHAPVPGYRTLYRASRNEHSAMLKKVFERFEGDYMHQSGGYWDLIMIAEDNDLILMKLMFGFTDENYRGYGDWAKKKKYHRAADNRITADEG